MAEGVNFGLLQNIPITNKVVATGSSTHSDAGAGGSINSLASGIVQGLKVGSDLQTAAVQRDGLRQQQQQSAALFPSKLKNDEAVAEHNQIVTQNEKDAREYNVSLQAAYKSGGINAYYDALDPQGKQAYTLAQTAITKNISEIAKTNAATDKQHLENFQTLSTTLGQVASSASTAAHAPIAPMPPQQLQQAVQQQVQAAQQQGQQLDPNQAAQQVQQQYQAQQQQKNMQNANNIISFFNSQVGPDMQKGVNIVFPGGQYNPDGAAIALRGATLVHQQQMLDNTKNGTETGKAQLLVEQNIATYKQAVASGDKEQIDQAKINLTISQQAQEQSSQGKGSNQQDPFTKEAATQQMKQVSTLDANNQGLNKLVSDTELASNKLDKIPKGFVGPINKLVSVGFASTDVQELQKLIAGIPLVQKSATLGQTAGARLFGSELEQMKQSSGTTNMNWDALKWIMHAQNVEAKGIRYDNWNKMNSNMQNVKDEKVYNNWISSHPKPEDPRTEVVKPDGSHITVPYSQRDAYIQAHKGAQRWE